MNFQLIVTRSTYYKPSNPSSYLIQPHLIPKNCSNISFEHLQIPVPTNHSLFETSDKRHLCLSLRSQLCSLLPLQEANTSNTSTCARFWSFGSSKLLIYNTHIILYYLISLKKSITPRSQMWISNR